MSMAKAERHQHPKYRNTTAALLALLLLTACGQGATPGDEDPTVTEPTTQAAAEQNETNNPETPGAGTGELVVDENIGAAEKFGPFDKLTLKAAANYSGITAEAELGTDSGPEFLHAVLFGTFPFAPDAASETGFTHGFRLGEYSHSFSRLYKQLIGQLQPEAEESPFAIYNFNIDADPLFPGEGIACAQGGTFDITAANTQTDSGSKSNHTFTYHNCGIGDYRGYPTLNGSAHISTVIGADGTANLYIGYDELSVTLNKQSIILTGAEKWSQAPACSLQGARTSYVLVHNQQNNESILYENFKTSLLGAEQGRNNSNCLQLFRSPNWYQGRLLYSSRGAVSVTTPYHLRYARSLTGKYLEVDQPATDNGTAFGGKLFLSGADSSELTFTYKKLDVPENYVVSYFYDQNSHPTIAVALTPPDGDSGNNFSVTSDAFNTGALSDLADNDADGIPNGWERLYSLDPDNAADATQDSDTDGLTALDEFEHQSNPTDVKDTGLSVEEDLQVTIGRSWYVTWGRTILTSFTINAYIHHEYLRPESMDITIRIVGNAHWNYYRIPSQCETDSSDEKLLHCSSTHLTRHSEEDQAFRFSGAVSSHSEGDISIIVELTGGELDQNNTNNRVEQVITMRAAEVDYSIDIAGDIVGNDSETHTAVATIKQSADTLKSEVTAFVSIPSGIEVLRADLLSDGPQAAISRCTINGKIQCDMDNVLNWQTLTLELDYKVLPVGEHTINWQLVTPQPDADLNNNSVETLAQYALPMAPLQALIDSAASGDVVQLPAGEYLGMLDGRGKTLEVRGATDGQPTVLISESADSYALSNVGYNSLYRHLTFRIAGSAVLFTNAQNLTIADSIFIPPTSGKHRTTGLVVGNNSYRLVNNRISGFGTGDNNACTQLIKLDGFRRTFVQHNVFVNTDCQGVIGINYPPRHSGTESEHLIGNNTFVDNKQLLFVSGHGIKSRVRFENNIVVNSDTLINKTRWQINFHSTGGLTTSRNLLYNSEREALLTGTLLAGGGYSYDLTDLSFDPVFVDGTTGNYQLSASSPAIDQGATATPFVYSNTTATHLKMMYDAEVIAVDGMQDGNTVIDPGAFEFTP